ncbi:MAG: ribonuclease P protein component [Alistipes sp.]|nr:ribonuclease P protein component [Candidatus Alistipes equi]
MPVGKNTLSKDEILRSYGHITRLFREGTGGFIYPFRYLVYTEIAPEFSCKVLFSVPKKFHKRANSRNLLKRRTKEAFRTNKALLWEEVPDVCVEVAFIYSTKEELNYQTIENAVKKIIQSVKKRY